MANQVAMGAQLSHGDEVILRPGLPCGELRGRRPRGTLGAQARGLPGARGLLSAAQVEEAIRPANDHLPRTRLVEIENTHNRGGGSVYALATVSAIAEVVRRHGLRLHIDGARLWNACAKSGIAPAAYASHAEPRSACASRRGWAPGGSLVAGSRELVATAHRLRKRLGGGMRQAGVLAAAGLYALDHNLKKLAEDHDKAHRLAASLAEAPGLKVDVDTVETNLIFAEVTRDGWNAPRAVSALLATGVLAGDADGKRLRFVTHLDFPASAVPEAAKRVAAALRS